MNNKYEEAIEVIKANYPPSNYTILREGLDLTIEALEKQVPKDVQKKLVGWRINCFCPSCTLEVFGRQSYCAVCGQYLNWICNKKGLIK